MPLTPAQLEARRAGGRARAKQFTRESQQYARAHLPDEAVLRGARNGYASTVAKHGLTKLREKAADKRRAAPSDLEITVASWLTEAGIDYEREVNIAGWYADFVVGRVAIEVNGLPWHTDSAWAGARQERDKRKRAAIEAAGYVVMSLGESDIKTERVKRSVLALLTNGAKIV